MTYLNKCVIELLDPKKMRDRTSGNEGKTGEGAGAWGGSFIVYSFRATELLN